ncbi:MAG TPA: universal stress protein [Acidimicrobiales bacterium]|nr:universal stress protein [Acidimicrobiales bacterium]
MSNPPVRVVLAALDTTTASRPVLETASRMAEMTGAQVEAIHVTDGPADMLDLLAGRAAIRLRRLSGPVEPAVLEAMAAPQVIAAVIGARATPGGRRPVGRTALRLLRQTTKPVVVVPPNALSPRPFKRLLVPLEGEQSSSQPIIDALWPLLVAEVELIVLHVFTDTTLPRMLDRPHRDLDLLGAEFLASQCPPATRIELRTGPVAARVAEVSDQHSVDLVVLSWSQQVSPGRAQVVQEVLGASLLPVLLLPVGSQTSPAASPSELPTS